MSEAGGQIHSLGRQRVAFSALKDVHLKSRPQAADTGGGEVVTTAARPDEADHSGQPPRRAGKIIRFVRHADRQPREGLADRPRTAPQSTSRDLASIETMASVAGQAFVRTGDWIERAVHAPFRATSALVARALHPPPHPLDGIEEAARYSALLRRFGGISALSDDELRLVQTTNFTDRRIHQAGSEIVLEGQRAPGPMFIVTGWACRIRILPGARRQVIHFLLPGDGIALDPEAAASSCTTVCALTTVETVDARPLLSAARQGCPALASALRRLAQHEQEFMFNHIVRLGSMPPAERVAHQFLELRWRLAEVGLATDMDFPLPVSRETLADSLGVTPRRLQRELRGLRRRGLAMAYAQRARVCSPLQLGDLTSFKPPTLFAVSGEPGQSRPDRPDGVQSTA